METTQELREGRQGLSKGRKVLQTVGYAVGGFGGQIPKTMIDTFASVFLITSAGIKPGQIAVMLMISKIIDAISDYLIGIAIDHTNCKFGRHRLWMLISIPVTLAGLLGLFYIPSGGNGLKLAWAYVFYSVLTTGITCVMVSENAIVPFLADDPGERGVLISSKLLLSMVGSMGVTGAVSALVNLTGGAESASSYFKAAAIIGVVFIIIILFAVANLHENKIEIPKELKKDEKKSNPIRDLKILFQNKNFVIVTIVGLICMFVNISLMSGVAYYAGYVLENDKLTGSILMPIMGGSMVTMISMGFLAKKFTKKKIATIGSILGAVFCVAILAAGANSMLMIVLSIVEGITFGLPYVTYFGMQPDVIDDVAYKSGRVMSGLIAAIFGFGANIGSALAAAVLAALIDRAGFDSTLAQQNDSVLFMIKLAVFILPAVLMAVIAVLVQFYDLDDKKMSEIRKKLGKEEPHR